MPESVEGADICWFSLPISINTKMASFPMYDGSKVRSELVPYLESRGIETRSLFAGNIIKHPAYKDVKYRVAPNGLEEADYILKHSFWITVHPRLTKDDLDFIIETFNAFFA